MVDGVKKTDMPTSPVGKDSKYYDVKVSCTSSKTTGLWDYNAWRLNLDYIESNSKCNLTFTSSMSKEEYDKYIQSGVSIRRNTYRGKDITKYYNGDEKFNDKDLYKQISDGTFDDIYVGDYFKGTSGTIWLIADLDNYLGAGGTKKITNHHATIIPGKDLKYSKMNETADTTGGYLNSYMVKTTLPEVLNTYIIPDFSNHIITYQNILSNSIEKNQINMFGTTSGASSNWEWAERQLDLMSEVNVYGTTIVSSSLYDTGLDNRQYAIFKLRPDLINRDLNGNIDLFWLKGVATSQFFTANYTEGDLFYGFAGADHVIGVRPRFLID